MGLVQYGGSDSEGGGSDNDTLTVRTAATKAAPTKTSSAQPVAGVRLLSSGKAPSTPRRSASPPISVATDHSEQPVAGPSHAPTPEWTNAEAGPSRVWGLARFGISEPTFAEPPDPALQSKLERFHQLSAQGHAFNASLMRNKAFRNPHILDKLVTFVNVDESGSNLGDVAWDRQAMLRDGAASILGERQRKVADQKSAAQAPGKRSNIDFAPATSTTTKPPASSSKWDASGSVASLSSSAKRDHRDRERDRDRGRRRSRSPEDRRERDRERTHR